MVDGTMAKRRRSITELVDQSSFNKAQSIAASEEFSVAMGGYQDRECRWTVLGIFLSFSQSTNSRSFDSHLGYCCSMSADTEEPSHEFVLALIKDEEAWRTPYEAVPYPSFSDSRNCDPMPSPSVPIEAKHLNDCRPPRKRTRMEKPKSNALVPNRHSE